VLVGVAMIAGCGDTEVQRRHVYKNRQDCLDDWGGNNKNCESAPYGSAHYSSGYYYGPSYTDSNLDSRGRRSISVSTAKVSRGGFGGSHSSGGG
jgi:uncharacterized protein YgiB involved in biofilm formation